MLFLCITTTMRLDTVTAEPGLLCWLGEDIRHMRDPTLACAILINLGP